MSEVPGLLQTLFLWRLLSGGGAGFLNRMKPELVAKDRKALEAAGLIFVEKKKPPQTGTKRVTASMHATLTEQGWEWASEHLDADFSMRSPASGPVLREILRKLKILLAARSVALADFIAERLSAPTAAAVNVPEQVRAAYCRITAGQWNQRVRLAALRRELAGVSRECLDATLLAMERDGTAILYPLDDPREIRPEDTAAAVANSLRLPRHIIFMAH